MTIYVIFINTIHAPIGVLYIINIQYGLKVNHLSSVIIGYYGNKNNNKKQEKKKG